MGILVDRAQSNWCCGFSDSAWPNYQAKFLPAAELRVRREEVSLYELPDADPMAFDRANPKTPLPLEFHGWGAEVEIPGKGPRTIVVNIVVRPVAPGGSGSQRLESSADEWGRMEIQVPDGVTHIEVSTDLHWRRGIVAAMGLAAATLAGMVLMGKSRYNGSEGGPSHAMPTSA